MFGNILIIDDSPLYVKMLTGILKQESHNVFVSFDGKDVYDIIDHNKIDAILLDIVLPDKDGFELLKDFQANNRSAEIPIIMITGLTDPQLVKKALDFGANDYIKKPAEPIEVIARVNAALRLKMKHDLLKEYAQRDNLTKLFNRGYIDKAVDNVLADKDKFAKGVSLLMLDCDFFKRINDNYGHISGDVVLQTIANVLLKSVKYTDIVGRFGGEEFVAILINTSVDEAAIVAERIRANVQKTRFVFSDQDVYTTISIGIAHIGENDDKLTKLEFIEKADKSLYFAKSTGRNKVSYNES